MQIPQTLTARAHNHTDRHARTHAHAKETVIMLSSIMILISAQIIQGQLFSLCWRTGESREDGDSLSVHAHVCSVL